MPKLKCPLCNTNLKLSVGFTGCDWDTVKGEGSGYGWDVSLVCLNDDCRALFTIGHVRNEYDFAEMKDGLKCVE